MPLGAGTWSEALPSVPGRATVGEEEAASSPTGDQGLGGSFCREQTVGFGPWPTSHQM